MAFFLGLVTVLVALFSLALSGYITFFHTAIESIFVKLALFAFLTVTLFLLTSMTALLVLWPPIA